MTETPQTQDGIRKSVLRTAAVLLAVVLVMAVVLELGRRAGGPYWVAAVVFCVVAYVVMMARAATLRQKIARWQSLRRRAGEARDQSEDNAP